MTFIQNKTCKISQSQGEPASLWSSQSLEGVPKFGGRLMICIVPQLLKGASEARGRLWPAGRLRPAGTFAAEGRLRS